MSQINVTIIVIAASFCVFALFLARSRILKISYALTWVATGCAIGLTVLIPGFLNLITRITGLYYITALLLLCFVFVLILFMHFSIIVSRLMYQNRILAERMAHLERAISDVESGLKNSGHID